MKYLVTVPIAIAIGIGITILDALVLSQLWDWFVTTHFKVPVPPLWILMGLILMPQLFTYTYHDPNDGHALNRLVMQVINPLVLLLVGWIIAHYVGGLS
jgi:hypothetical protein